MMALICLFKKCSELNKNTGSESSYFLMRNDMSIKTEEYRLIFIFLSLLTLILLGACQTIQTSTQATLPNICNGTTTGSLINGKFNGQASHSCADGFKYIGELRDDKRNGHGTGTWANGEIYVGQWADDKQNGQGAYTFPNGDKYVGEFKDGNRRGQGTYTYYNGDKYVGEWKDGKQHGQGTYYYLADNLSKGDIYVGEWKGDKRHGLGIYTKLDGRRLEGVWENDNLVREAKVNLPNPNNNTASNSDRANIDREPFQLAQDRRQLEEKKRQREKQRRAERFNLKVSHTQAATDGSFTINIQTNADIASLKINGEEQGGRASGGYIVKKFARAGQETKFTIVATDVNGNTDTKTIAVSRQVVESKAAFAALNPANIKKQVERDAVAVVIGIADYRSLPKAEFANDDARAFYDYAIRALGIKPENIRLLVDGDAEEAEILKTFRTWLPSRVKSTTEVFVFYSGHGLPMPDGKGLYLVPPRADREVIDDTAIPFSKINATLTLAKPKSVTIFLDACYSGQARSGETLVASARPVQVKSDSRYFPENFTVITASQNDQISSSNPELQHGIFSYYLMKGMEGDADENRDGKITLGEMQSYLSENVSRHAAMMSRKQEPQLIGDVNRVLVGR
jgi:hypothetical protein